MTHSSQWAGIPVAATKNSPPSRKKMPMFSTPPSTTNRPASHLTLTPNRFWNSSGIVITPERRRGPITNPVRPTKYMAATIGVLMAAAIYFVGRTGFVIGPLRRSGVMTIPELFQKRFGVKVRWLAGLFVVLGGVLNMGIFLRLGGEFLVAATGMPAHWLEWVMTILLGMILLYTVLGGMLSVLVTDYIQFVVK